MTELIVTGPHLDGPLGHLPLYHSTFDRFSTTSKDITRVSQTDSRSSFESFCSRASIYKEIVTDTQTDSPPDLPSVRPDENTSKELPVRHDYKPEEDTERHKPAGAEFDAQTPEKQDKSSPVKNLNGDSRQVNGSGIRTTSKKYYLRSILEIDKCSIECNASGSNDPESETEKKSSVAKRVAARKAYEAAGEQVIAQGKENDNQQEIPTKGNLKKIDSNDGQVLPIRENPGKKDDVDDQQELPIKDDLGKKKSVEDK
ncbi:hypothetical protein N7491_003158 [Penicillium cf. griseofulvum]|uniref:Uncharacterized protein n=1 Tax=Penicillium cf. griseofulvum TaxID=2972120 RepID=A0A9W9MRJ5_9EURO|nr:hypothetical protein N7472_002669 [Penicillium cf. griseofulvum]KAJ5440752.1 hypothetical protein N7491_003158 [Penicillium cf. griseofulvum]